MSDMGQRVLGRVRLSRSSEESTSVERQREVIEAWAKTNDHQIVGWAEDVDVSGSVDPFDTPQLGNWLEDREPSFDVICVWKLDRLSRNSIHLNRLFGWCLDRGKTVVSATEAIDLSSPTGRLLANVIGFLAEGELEAISERQRSSRAKLRRKARWAGGRPPYGYRAVKAEDGWTLEVNEETAAVMRRIVDAVLTDYPLTRLAIELTEEGVPTPSGKGAKWSQTVMRNMLRSRAMLGHVHQTVHANDCRKHWDGWCRKNCGHETVRDDEGKPLRMADPLVTVEEFQRIQRRLDQIKESRANVKRSTASPLSGVAYCVECDQSLYLNRSSFPRKDGGKYEYRYYQCKPCSVMVKADHLEAQVEKEFLDQLGDVPVRERRWIPGDSRESELAEAIAGVDEIAAALGRAKSATARQRLQMQLDALDEQIAELEKAPSREARWEYVGTGQTYREVWESADGSDERRELLKRSGITVSATKIAIYLHIPAEIKALVRDEERFADGWQPPTTKTVIEPEPDGAFTEALRKEFNLG